MGQPRLSVVKGAMAEVPLNPDICQRWRTGAHSWRHRSDGGFDSSRYEAAAIDELGAKEFVIAHHYSGSVPASRLRIGLYDLQATAWADPLVGVAIFSVPVQAAVLTNVFPDLVAYEETLELGRFVLLDEVPANAETWFLARCFELVAQAGLRGVVSFSDPVPRHGADGRLVMPGHHGGIYIAKGAIYLGRATPRTLRIAPDGTVLNERSLQKVRAQERGHDHVERLLVRFGARVPHAGEDMGRWVAEAVITIGSTTVRHRGNHRYAFKLGRTKAERRRVRIAMEPQRAPRRSDALLAA